MFRERQPPTEIGSKAVVHLFFEFYSNVVPHSKIRLQLQMIAKFLFSVT